MGEQVETERLNGRWRLPAVLLCFLVACGGELRGATSFRLSEQGYSPISKTLLFRGADTDNLDRGSFLATYDEVSGSVKQMAIPGNHTFTDSAWVPGRAAFTGVDMKQVILFQKESSGDGYTSTLIPSPGTGVLPLQCSWSPKGQCLAVNCMEYGSTSGALWLYKFGDNALRKTGVAVDYGTLAWGDENLLYGTKDDAVLTIKLTGEKASVVRTTRVLGKITIFYGTFDEQPLYLSYGAIGLGYKTLVDLDRPSAKFRVIGTEKTIFVSSSSRHLVAFDTAGNPITASNPGRLIRFGSIRDPNTVYGLSDSSLVRVSVEKGALKIQTVADLNDAVRAGPGEGGNPRK